MKTKALLKSYYQKLLLQDPEEILGMLGQKKFCMPRRMKQNRKHPRQSTISEKVEEAHGTPGPTFVNVPVLRMLVKDL